MDLEHRSRFHTLSFFESSQQNKSEDAHSSRGSMTRIREEMIVRSLLDDTQEKEMIAWVRVE